jgi:hypothetical protein
VPQKSSAETFGFYCRTHGLGQEVSR